METTYLRAVQSNLNYEQLFYVRTGMNVPCSKRMDPIKLQRRERAREIHTRCYVCVLCIHSATIVQMIQCNQLLLLSTLLCLGKKSTVKIPICILIPGQSVLPPNYGYDSAKRVFPDLSGLQ